MIDRSKHRSVYRGERDRVDAYARPRWWCCSPHQLTPPPLLLLASQFPGPLINKQTSVLHKKPRFINITSLPRPCLITSGEVHEARLPRTCSRPCAFEVKRTKKTKSHQTLKTHTTKYIHSSPATATTTTRRAVKHVPLGSPYSHSSFIHLGLVENGLACIHTYVHTRSAAAAPPVYVLVIYTILWPAQLRLSLL